MFCLLQWDKVLPSVKQLVVFSEQSQGHSIVFLSSHQLCRSVRENLHLPGTLLVSSLGLQYYLFNAFRQRQHRLNACPKLLYMINGIGNRTSGLLIFSPTPYLLSHSIQTTSSILIVLISQEKENYDLLAKYVCELSECSS